MGRPRTVVRTPDASLASGLEVAGPDPSIQVSFKHALSFGPGKLRLLEEIESTGSISASARRMGMSYKRAWDLAAGMNAAFRVPLIATQSDGRRLGGAMLTDHGRHVMEQYRRIRAAALIAISEEFEAFRGLLAHEGGAEDADG